MRAPTSDTLPAGTVTFLLTDVEGSTTRWETGPLRMAAAMREHDSIIDAAVARFGGARPIEQGEGDSALIAFRRPSDALAAAVAIQRDLATTGPDGLRVRMGIHTGEATPNESGRYAGGMLNRGARIRALASGGQVLLSAATAALAADTLPVGTRLDDLGAHALRGLAQPEHLFQLTHPDLFTDFPPIATPAAGVRGAPVQRTTFVGREAELVALHRMLDEHALVTLTGAGGSGKTRLATELARAVGAEFPSGAYFVDLAVIEDAELVIAAMAMALGVTAGADGDLDAAVDARLDEGRCLVVLDNCEHLLEPVARLAQRWVAVAEQLTIVATSREPLGIAGEVVWRLASLACPKADATPADAAASEAVTLFVDRARAARPELVLDDAALRAVAGVCRRLDGLPLAIELAAAHVRSMTPQEIEARIDDRFRLLRGSSRSAVARQRTLEASVAWSYRLVPPDQQAALAACSVLAGGFDVAAAAAVTRLDEWEAAEVLGALVDHSLLVADARPDGTTRYRMLETIQQFGRERLDERDGSATARDRQAAHFLAVAEALGPGLEGPDGPRIERSLAEERDNLWAAYEWLARTDPPAAVRLAVALQRHWSNLGPGGYGLAQLLALLADDQALTEAERVAGLGAAVEIAMSSGQLQLAAELAVDAADRAGAVGDRRLEGRVRAILAAIVNWSDGRAGAEQADRARACATEAGDLWGLADAITSQGHSALALGDHRRAAALFDEAMVPAEQLGSWHLRSFITFYMGVVALYTGATDRMERATRAMELGREAGDRLLVGIAARMVALAESLAGHHEEARAALDVARPRIVDIDWAGALVEFGAGDLHAAQACLRPAGEPGPATAASQLLWYLFAARTNLALGDVVGAGALAESARALAIASAHRHDEARADLTLGRIARRGLDDPHAAEDHVNRALEFLAAGGFVPDVADALDELAGVAADLDSGTEAARLLGAADATRMRVGAVRPVPDEDALGAVERRARELVGDEGFDAAYESGRTLSVDEAVEYVRRSRGERKRPMHGWDSLTPTERRVAELVAEGLTNPQIADRMLIGAGTVKTHVAHIFTKLGFTRRAQLVAALVRRSAS